MNQNIFLKDKIVYSDIKKNLELPKNFSKFKIPNKTENINKLIEETNLEIEEIIKKTQEIKVSGEIKNFETIKKKIVKEKLNKVDKEDYDFIEFTAQIEILNQIIENSQKQHEENKNIINSVIESFTPLNKNQKEKEEKITNEINISKNNLKKHLKDIDLFKEKELNTLIKQEKETNSLISKFEKEKNELNKKFENISKLTKNSNTEAKLNLKVSKIEFKINSIKLDIDIIKAKITTLKNHIKLKRDKQIKPISFILTLGLIYWTKYSDTKYIKNSLELKIHKKEEEISKLNKELFILKQELEYKSKENINDLKEISKKEEDIQNKIENLEKEIKNKNIKIKEISKHIQKQEKIIETYNKETHKLKEELNKLESKLENIKNNSTENIIEKLKKELTNDESKIEKIKNFKNILENQKIDIEGEFFLKI